MGGGGGGGGGLISGGGWGISGSLRYFIFHPQLKYMSSYIYSLTEITLKSIIISNNVLFYLGQQFCFLFF